VKKGRLARKGSIAGWGKWGIRTKKIREGKIRQPKTPHSVKKPPEKKKRNSAIEKRTKKKKKLRSGTMYGKGRVKVSKPASVIQKYKKGPKEKTPSKN